MSKARSTLSMVIGCALAFELSALAGSSTPKDVLVVPVTSITNFNPYTGNDFSLNKVINQVTSTLVALDDSLAPIPALAASWTVDSAAKEITFTLAKGIQFHDGSAIQSKDVFLLFQKSVSGGSDLTSQLLSFSDCRDMERCPGFKAVSETIFTLKLKDQNFPLLLRKLAGVEGAVYKINHEGSRFIGSGPYRIVSVGVNEIVAESINPKNSLRQIIFRKIPSDTALAEFNDHKIDLINNIEFSFDEKEIPKSAKRQDLVSVTFGLVFQTQKASIFYSPEVRKAVAMAIDKKELIAKYGKRAIPADGLVPKGFLGYESQSSSFNVSQAKAAIEKYVPKSRRKVTLGLRDRFRGNPDFEVFLRDSFRKIGLTLEIQYDNFNSILGALKAGKSYDMTIKGDTPRYYESSTVFNPYIHGQSQNISGYKNEHLNELYFLYEKTVRQDEKLRIIRDMESIIRQDVPVVPLFYPVQSNWYQQDLVTRDFKDLSIRLWDFPYHKLARQSP